MSSKRCRFVLQCHCRVQISGTREVGEGWARAKTAQGEKSNTGTTREKVKGRREERRYVGFYLDIVGR